MEKENDMYNDISIEVLLGKTLVEVKRVDEKYEGDVLLFTTSENKKYKMFHQSDCCEDVYIESIVGDLNDLIGETLLVCSMEQQKATEENTDGKIRDNTFECGTWTFYKFATRKGYVDIRWVGLSNGYYSEEVNFMELA